MPSAGLGPARAGGLWRRTAAGDSADQSRVAQFGPTSPTHLPGALHDRQTSGRSSADPGRCLRRAGAGRKGFCAPLSTVVVGPLRAGTRGMSTKEVVASFWTVREANVGGHMTQASAARRTSSGASSLEDRAPKRGFGGSARRNPAGDNRSRSEGSPGSSKRAPRPVWISYPDAAELTTLSVRSLKRLTADGKLPCFLIGGKVLRLRLSDVEALAVPVDQLRGWS